MERTSRPQSGVSALCGFLRAKACFVTLQVVVLVLCAQAMLRYSGGAASPGARGPGGLVPRARSVGASLYSLAFPQQAQPARRRTRADGAPARSASAAGGARRRRRGAGTENAQPERNTVFTPVCAPIDDPLREGAPPASPLPVLLDVAVASECNSRARRDAVRKGWGSFARTLGMRYRFFVGLARGDDKHCETSISAEMRRFDDIVVLPLVDTYENLTQKVMGMMTYTAKCGSGLFYAKCDDDVFVYAWRLKGAFDCVVGWMRLCFAYAQVMVKQCALQNRHHHPASSHSLPPSLDTPASRAPPRASKRLISVRVRSWRVPWQLLDRCASDQGGLAQEF